MQVKVGAGGEAAIAEFMIRIFQPSLHFDEGIEAPQIDQEGGPARELSHHGRSRGDIIE
jgi:hypothetical protein